MSEILTKIDEAETLTQSKHNTNKLITHSRTHHNTAIGRCVPQAVVFGCCDEILDGLTHLCILWAPIIIAKLSHSHQPYL